MASLPVEILLGIYLGLLVGIIPALVSWLLGFGFKYIAGVALPGFGVAVLAIALAGVNGGLLALTDRTILDSPAAPRVLTAIVIVAMLSMYAHSKGDEMAAGAPQRPSLADIGQRTLSLDLADIVGDRETVRIHVVGQVADVEGYPPLPEDLRAEIRDADLTFPADLRVGELEERVGDRLRTEFDLGEVTVDIDERGRASVAAAPPFSGLSKRVSDGRHAVSVDGLIPTGLARGDEVTLITTDAQVRGTVVSARTGDAASAPDIDHRSDAAPATDEAATSEVEPAPVRAPTTTGGEGRLTVAVTRTDVQPLLRADRAKVVVESRGTRREFELISLLRRADRRFRRLTLGQDSPLLGTRLADLRLREDHGVDVLAVRRDRGWVLAPAGDDVLAPQEAVLAVGDREALDRFRDVVA